MIVSYAYTLLRGCSCIDFYRFRMFGRCAGLDAVSESYRSSGHNGTDHRLQWTWDDD